MEGSWIKANNKEHTFLTESFKEICPFFISIGMTYDQFWRDDVTIAKDYLEAYKIKQKREDEINQWNIWKQGVYIYEALCDVSPILHAFAKKGTKPLPFPKKPYEYNEEEIEHEPTEEEVQTERLKAQIFFNNLTRAMKNKK